MARAAEYSSILLGSHALRGTDVVQALARSIEGNALALQWQPGCREGEAHAVPAAWFELEQGGAWLVCNEAKVARMLCATLADASADATIEYVQGHFSIDPDGEECSAEARQFQWASGRLDGVGTVETDAHDGNATLIALDAAGLLSKPLRCGGGLYLWLAERDAKPTGQREPAWSRTLDRSEVRAELVAQLERAPGHVRRISQDAYIVNVYGDGRGGIPLSAAWTLDTAELASIRNELETRGLADLLVPSLDGP